MLFYLFCYLVTSLASIVIRDDDTSYASNSIYGYGYYDMSMGSNSSKAAFYAEDQLPQLSKRTDVRTCLGSSKTANCLALGSLLVSLSIGVANLVYTKSQSKSCTDTGVQEWSQDGDTVYYRYHATGRNCDTTAELSTIAGSIEKWFKKENSGKVCGFQCLSLTHGGTWTGYVSVGTNQDLIKYTSCNQNTGSFSSCESGGKNDLTKRAVALL